MKSSKRLHRLAAASALAAAMCLSFTQLAAAAHAVKAHGSGHVKPTWGVDFDKGVFNGNSSAGEDLKFDINGGDRFLQPYWSDVNLKRMSSKPGYSKCASANLVHQDYNVAAVPNGTWFCIKTHQGRFARFRLDHVDPSPGNLYLTFTTWV